MDLTFYAYQMLGSAPLFMVWLAGLALCANRAKVNRTTCVLTAMALLIAVFMHVVFPLASTWFFKTYLKDLHEISLRILLNSLTQSVPHTVMWVLLLCVIFKVRNPAAAR